MVKPSTRWGQGGQIGGVAHNACYIEHHLKSYGKDQLLLLAKLWRFNSLEVES